MDKTEILLSTTAEKDGIHIQMEGTTPALMSLLTYGVVSLSNKLGVQPIDLIDHMRGAILYNDMLTALSEEEEEQ